MTIALKTTGLFRSVRSSLPFLPFLTLILFLNPSATRAQQPSTPSEPARPSSATETASASAAAGAPKPEPATAADEGDPIDRIKEEGLKNAQVLQTLSYVTDVIGPRLTGSPNLKRANAWTRDKLTSW
jgi:hypothetical protein